MSEIIDGSTTLYKGLWYAAKDNNPYYYLAIDAGKAKKEFIIHKDCKSISPFSISNNVLKKIRFEGTKQEWQKIDKLANMNYSNKYLTIICSDGELEFEDIDIVTMKNYLDDLMED